MRYHPVALLLVLLLVVGDLGAAQNFCPALSQVWDSSAWKCIDCPIYATSTVENTCECVSGYAMTTYSGIDESSRCVDCASRKMVVSSFLSMNASQYCVSCGGDTQLSSVLLDATFDTSTKSCRCASGTVLVEQMGPISLTGQMCLPCTAGDCITCSFPYVRDPASYSCVCGSGYVALYDGSCAPEGAYGAMASLAQSYSYTLIPPNVDNTGEAGSPVVPLLVYTNAVGAATACSMGKRTACDYLANMCVLMLYDQQSVPCALYLSLRRKHNCVENSCQGTESIPWLYYTSSSVEMMASTSSTLKKPLANFQLQFVLSTYNVNGNWKGYYLLVEQLNQCRLPNTAVQEFFRTGSMRSYSCNFNWRWFLAAPQTLLYEVFLVNPHNSSELIPIPLLIDYTNQAVQFDSLPNKWLYRSASSDGTPLANSYRRRFYTYDNVGGNSTTTTIPSYVITTWSVSFLFGLSNSAPQYLLSPLVVLRYASREGMRQLALESNLEFHALHQEPLNTSDGSGTLRTHVASLFLPSTYTMNYVLMIVLIISLCLCLLSAWVRLYGWLRRRQNLVLDVPATLRYFIYYCDHFGTVCFLVVSFASWYTLVSYKSQRWLDVAISSNVKYLSVFLYLGIAMKSVSVLYALAEQCNADYFIIDWERSKGQLLRENKIVPVSMWRSTFLANELNELQVLRFWHPLLAMTIILLLLLGLDYGNVSSSVIHSVREQQLGSVSLHVLRIAIDTFFWCAVCLLMYSLEYQIYYRFIVVHPLRAFVDLCSVSNISVMILVEPQWGYYIHGESIYAHTDVSMEEFQQNLFLEAQGNLPVRGLGGQSKCQNFEIFLGAYTRQYLYMCYTEMMIELQNSRKKKGSHMKVANPAQWHFLSFITTLSRKARVYSQEALAIKDRINAAFQHSVRHAEGSLLSKFTLHRWLSFPPNVLYMSGPQPGDKVGRDLYFFDDIYSYRHALMCGMDVDLFMLYALIFSAIDAALENSLAAMVIVFIIELILEWYRKREGLVNVCNKTMIDDRFLM